MDRSLIGASLGPKAVIIRLLILSVCSFSVVGCALEQGSVDAGVHDFGGPDADLARDRSDDAGRLDVQPRPGDDGGVSGGGVDVGPPLACTPDGPTIVDVVPTYGGFRPEAALVSVGLALALSERWIVFADRRVPFGTQLALVEVEGDRLVRRHSVVSTLMFDVKEGGLMDWKGRVFGSLVPLGGLRFAVVGGSSGVEVYEAQSGNLVRTHRLELPLNQTSFGASVYDGGALWLCGFGTNPFQPVVYRITEGGLVPEDDPPGVRLRGCRDVALSSTGEAVLARFLDPQLQRFRLDEGGAGPVDSLQTTHPFASVSAGPRYFAGIELRAVAEAGKVAIYETRSARLVGELEPRDKSPLGVAVTDDDLLLVTWLREPNPGNPRSSLELELHRLTSHSIERLSAHPLGTFQGRQTVTFQNPSVHGRLAVIQPGREVFRIEPDGRVEELTGPGHGGLHRLVALPDGRGLALGSRFASEIQVGPETLGLAEPVLLAPATGELRLISSGGRVVWDFPRQTSLLRGYHRMPRAETQVDVLVDADHRFEARGPLTLDGGPAALVGFGGDLLQLTADGQLRQLRPEPEAAPDRFELRTERDIPPAAWPGLTRTRRPPTVATDGQDLLIVSGMSETSSVRSLNHLRWLDPQRPGTEAEALFEFFGVHGHRGNWAFLHSDSFLVRRRTEAGLEALTERDLPVGVGSENFITWFDGASLGFSARDRSPPSQGSFMVYAGERLERSWSLPIDAPVLDAIELRGGWVLVTQTEIILVTRPCL